MAISCSILCPKKFRGRKLNNKKIGIPYIASCSVLPSSSGHVKTDIKQIECLAVFPANICLFKVNNGKTRKRCEVVQS